ncbi:MAG: hypothetical protein DRG78_20175 [Epsilonproteobacteria bacterium]|nr:MAG: hypothetical protein DRG78_20175 [Campylobacterota bacterium]
MTKTIFKIDMAKAKTVGGGSISTFCKRNNILRAVMYQMNGAVSFRDGSKAQAISEKLINLNVGKWIEVEKISTKESA